jgi:uncharacterized protein (TIGR02118 family)
LADLVVLHKTPNDAAAFDKCYFENHIPLAKKLPGLRKYRVTKGPVATQGGPSNLHLIAVPSCDNMAAIKAAFASAEGKAAAADVPKFATGGVEMNFSETAEV